jgi:nucleoside-diphosphate-sugar epimerase
MVDPDLHVVLGAAGVTGRLVVQQLLAAGRSVRAVTRDGRNWQVGGLGRPQWTAADASDRQALTAACRDARVVYHCVMPPLLNWRTRFPPITDAVVAAATAAQAHLIYADNTWMHGRVATPIAPDTPWRPVSGLGVLRAWLAERLLRAGEAGQLPVSIVRAGELYGPQVRSLIAENVFGAARRGGIAHWPGDPDQPITPTFVADFADTLVAVGLSRTTGARIWHVPHPAATTGRAFAAEAYRQAGHRLRLLGHPARRLRWVGVFSPTARAGAELIYQFEQPFVVDGSATAHQFQLHPTPYPTGIAATLRASPSEPRHQRPSHRLPC